MKTHFETRKILGTIIGVLAFIALVAGLTYAWFTWFSENTELSGITDCFTVTYTNGQAISGEITPTSVYNQAGSKTTTATLGITEGCVDGTAIIKFTVNDTTTMPLDKGAIKYAVTYEDPTDGSTKVVEGVVDAVGTINLATGLPLNTDPITYTIYIWADQTLVDNDFTGTSFSGYIHASAQQTPDNQ